MKSLVALALLVIVCSVGSDSSVLMARSAVSPADDWPKLRGPHESGVSDEVDWSMFGVELWKRSVGLGYSSPSIAGDVLVIQGFDEARGEDTIFVLDALTGEVRWSLSESAKARAVYHGGGTLTTATIDGDRVYQSNREGVLRCLALEDGAQIWRRELAADHEVRVGGHGVSGSPVLYQDMIVVSLGGTTVAVAAEDGADRWQGPTYPAGFSTPSRFSLAGRDAFLSFTGMGLAVIAADSGEELSTFEWFPSAGGACCAAPVVVGERVFVSAAYNLGGAMVEFDDLEAKAAWTTRRMRNKVNPCVLYDDHLYGFDESMLKCMDLNGREQWRHRGLGMGSLSIAGGRLIVLSSEGELLIAPATPEGFEPGFQQSVLEGGVYWTSPVLAHGRIYCRNSLGDLVCRDHNLAPGVAQQTHRPGVAELPPAADLFARHLEAIGGEDAVRAHTSVHMEGTIEVLSAGSTISTVEIDRLAPDLTRFAYLFPEFGWVEECYDGEQGWVVHPWKDSGLFEGDLLREWQDKSPYHDDCDPGAMYSEMRTVSRQAFAGQDCFVVTATTTRGAERQLYFDAATGFLVGRDGPTESMEEFGDYRRFDGVLVATRRRILEPDTGEERKIVIQKVTFDEVERSRFAMPPKIAWLKLPPEVVEARNTAAAQVHAPLLGRFQAEGFVVEIRIHQGGLAFGFGTTVMELTGPDDEDLFALNETTRLRFDRDDTGAVTSLALLVEGEPEQVCPRLVEGDSSGE